MVVYSIKDMESMSGVKAHTIRIWEKRYGIIKPKRTETNIRYYTDKDLRHLLNVCILYKKGYKISKIAEMSEEEIRREINSHISINIGVDDQVDALMLFILDLDSYNFNKVIDQHIDQEGLEMTMSSLIYPLLDKISLAWLAGSFQGVHESFVSQILKSKVQKCIEDLPNENDYSPKYVIYLPEGEREELSLLYLHYILKKHQCEVINLGTQVGLRDVILACNTTNPDYLFTIINQETPRQTFQNYIDQICSNLEKTEFLLTGYQVVAQMINWPDKITCLKNLEASIDFIRNSKESKRA